MRFSSICVILFFPAVRACCCKGQDTHGFVKFSAFSGDSPVYGLHGIGAHFVWATRCLVSLSFKPRQRGDVGKGRGPRFVDQWSVDHR